MYKKFDQWWLKNGLKFMYNTIIYVAVPLVIIVAIKALIFR